ncbi:hypothetical protein G7054_g4504 [Neopestalotiopsis clavispora]|nr:hypothetical protein G7054_g4504 [Neopestalotiopsis clavispora]
MKYTAVLSLLFAGAALADLPYHMPNGKRQDTNGIQPPPFWTGHHTGTGTAPPPHGTGGPSGYPPPPPPGTGSHSIPTASASSSSGLPWNGWGWGQGHHHHQPTGTGHGGGGDGVSWTGTGGYFPAGVPRDTRPFRRTPCPEPFRRRLLLLPRATLEYRLPAPSSPVLRS